MNDGKHLALNEIGDTLGGMFAPLAFVWLFIATWLQKSELSLQRRELEETRKVLDSQMSEMKRAADESNTQTEIMNKTLDATLSRDIYDTFALKLYYLAFWMTSQHHVASLHVLGREGGVREFDIPNFGCSAPSDKEASLDAIFIRALVSLNRLTADGVEAFYDPQRNYGADNQRAKELLIVFHRSLSNILSDRRYEDNSIVHARIEGLALDLVLVRTKMTIDRIRLP